MVFSKRLDMFSVSVILLQYQRQVLTENFRFVKSYGYVKNGMLYNDNAKIINTQLSVSITDMKPCVQQNQFGTRLKNRSFLFLRYLNSKVSILG